MSGNTNLYCYAGIQDKDISLSSLEAKYAQLLRTRTPCQSVSFLNAAEVTTNELVVQNLTVTNSFMIPPSAGGLFNSTGGVAANLAANVWTILSLTEFPLVADANNVGLTLAGNTITVTDEGWYIFSTQGTFTNAAAVDVGVSINGADPTFSLTTLPAGMGTIGSATTLLYLSPGDTLNAAANASMLTTLTVNPGQISISFIGS